MVEIIDTVLMALLFVVFAGSLIVYIEDVRIHKEMAEFYKDDV